MGESDRVLYVNSRAGSSDLELSAPAQQLVALGKSLTLSPLQFYDDKN